MLGKYYNQFINNSIEAMENDTLYADKLKRLKELTLDEYNKIMNQDLLCYFIENYESYKNNQEYHHEEKKLTQMIDSTLYQYELSCQTYLFDVTVEGYEDKITRTIQLPHDATLGTLGLAIIASLECINGDFYMTSNDGYVYSSHYEEDFPYEEDAFETYIYYMNLDDDIEMKFYTFNIKIHFRGIKMVENIFVPQIYQNIDGKGYGLCFDEELKELYDHNKKDEEKILENISKPYIQKDIEERVQDLIAENYARYFVSEEDFDDE